MKMLWSALGACVMLCLAAPAFAAPDSAVCPNGVVANVRISSIKPTGTRAGFDAAVRDHIKWYRDHGFTANEQVVADVLDRNGDALGVSAKEVMTIHYNPPNVPSSQHDAAWDAFVAEYRANSDIVAERTVCLPKR